MEVVAKRNQHGQGNYNAGRWRLRNPYVKMSTKQLSEYFKTQVPESESGSRPFWLRFLRDWRAAQDVEKKKKSHLKARIESLELLIGQLKSEGRDVSLYEAELRRCLDEPARNPDPANPPAVTAEEKQEAHRRHFKSEAEFNEWLTTPTKETEPSDVPVVHPDAKAKLDALRLFGVDVEEPAVVCVLNATVPKPIPKRESLKAEMDSYLDRYKARAKNKKAHYEVKAVLDLFFSVTGPIRVKDVTVQHYRDYLDKVQALDVSATTKARRQQTLHTFFRRLESDHNIVFGFIRNPDYRLGTPEGQKVQYSMDQVQTALKNATGEARTALLLGLNCGAYYGDIEQLKPENIKDGRIVQGRAKLTNRDGIVKGLECQWLIWPETREVLRFGLTTRELQREFMKLRKAHDLPEHKALRKTVSQWIEDNVGEVEARLYRAEKPAGTHGRYYIKLSPEQVAKLDKALTVVHRMLFGSGSAG